MERQQVLYLWANGSSLDSGTVGWAFHDGTKGAGPQLPDGSRRLDRRLDAAAIITTHRSGSGR
jgi:hypothetical protein